MRLRRLAIALVVVALALVLVDRITAYLAGQQVGARLQQRAGLAQRPAVTVGGVPFLTQLVAGDYRQVDVVATGVQASRFTDLTVTARLRGIHVPVSQLLGGTATQVPVDDVQATVVLPYQQIANATGIPGLELSAHPGGSPGQVLVSGRVTVLGRAYTVTATARLAVLGRQLQVTADPVTVLDTVVPPALRAVAAQGLSFRLSLPTLPYGLRVTGARPTEAGVELTATGQNVVLDSSR